MTDSGADDAPLETRFATIETALAAALGAKVAALGADLKARIEAKLSGGVLATKSGALLASLTLEEAIDASSTIVSVASHGVPYARIQEFGGRTEAHDIVAIKAKALAFTTDGKACFAKRVHHPGSVIPQRSFMRSALDEMHDEIVADLKAAVWESIRAG
jgi:phage gpG-like protein